MENSSLLASFRTPNVTDIGIDELQFNHYHDYLYYKNAWVDVYVGTNDGWRP